MMHQHLYSTGGISRPCRPLAVGTTPLWLEEENEEESKRIGQLKEQQKKKQKALEDQYKKRQEQSPQLSEHLEP
jgi:hypothetical protein